MNSEVFLMEASDLLARVETAIMDLESDPANEEIINETFRHIHTIKGSAGIFGFSYIMEFAHLFESMLDRCRQGMEVTHDITALALDSVDALTCLVELENEPPDAELESDVNALKERLAFYANSGPQEPQEEMPDANEEFEGIFLFPESIDEGAEEEPQTELGAPPMMEQAEAEPPTMIAAEPPTLIVAPPPETPKPPAPAAGNKGGSIRRNKEKKSDGESQFMKVKSQHLTQLMDLIGELVTGNAKVRLAAQGVAARELKESLEVQEKLLEQLRDTALRLRMSEMGGMFQHFRRLVRELGRDLGKEVSFETSGQDTDLDKTIIERITAPLMHLIRNSMDHGLETPEERLEAGKNRKGLVSISAHHEFGSVVIEVIDDGRGIDREKVLRKAREAGLVNSDMAPSDPAVLDLIFHPGFSTADKVSAVSGRGVGMDVVKRSVEELQGKIAVESTPGQGSRFELRLPLTTAIINGFLVRVGTAFLIVPLEVVLECSDLVPDEGPDAPTTGCVDIRGELVPFVRLDKFLKLTKKQDEHNQALLTIHHTDGKIGFVVDELIGEFQTVVRPLGPVFQKQTCFNGATILGNGSVAMILNISAVVQSALLRSAREAA